MGSGSEVVETGRIDRFRLTGASEGAPIAQVYGRVRLSGQVIWATRFQEQVRGQRRSVRARRRSRRCAAIHIRSVVAIALCEGEISGVGRVWADGKRLPRDDAEHARLFRARTIRLPDPKIEAVEGAGLAPAYRGDGLCGDRGPGPGGLWQPRAAVQFRGHARAPVPDLPDLSEAVRAVALMPGTGEYALATTPVHFEMAPGRMRSANVNSPSGVSRFRDLA